MILKWYGHACFYLELDNIKFVMDPYGGDLGYPDLNITADIVTISHNHFDHNNHQVVKSNPRVITSPDKVIINDVACYGIPAYHDLTQGSQRGNNIIFVFEGEGLKIAHCGDLGHPLPAETVKRLNLLDFLLIPIGGVYTIGPETAYQVTKSIQTKVVIPMHYKTEHLKFNLDPVDNYLKHFDSNKIRYLNQPEISVTSDYLKNTSGEIWVLSY
ncbi:MAG: hypothetical protein DDT40_00389 [candidate division WS2 bacterium]|uniref:MBL fold metallo-hydrolase n=1 Tax=Psychracetigena formicireducens TaxID=2986056 RepID=A0A9E2BGS9_PSYF1|nr:hypothetical protein [Candidatus Psychracetigena formicireducens]MBT9144754.1 hypothetical protein [Candidatus Psychracetigena formicireducens]MBT9150221.1 hypothetical protein [Candidatus Psychracetigena formicireducens]